MVRKRESTVDVSIFLQEETGISAKDSAKDFPSRGSRKPCCRILMAPMHYAPHVMPAFRFFLVVVLAEAPVSADRAHIIRAAAVCFATTFQMAMFSLSNPHPCFRVSQILPAANTAVFTARTTRTAAPTPASWTASRGAGGTPGPVSSVTVDAPAAVLRTLSTMPRSAAWMARWPRAICLVSLHAESEQTQAVDVERHGI